MQQEKEKSESSYEQGSSQEIIVELGQANKDMIGSKVTDKSIAGDFGLAEIFKNKGDKLVIYDPNHHELKIINQIYRGIIVKTNKKKQTKNPQLTNQANNHLEEEQANERQSENLFDSSESSHEETTKKKKKKAEKKKPEDMIGKTRIIRKIRTLSKKQEIKIAEK